MNEFSDRLIRDQIFYHEKSRALYQLHTRLKGSENYFKAKKLKLSELTDDHHYQNWGDLLMANMHLIRPGQEKISLPSFYDRNLVEIKLKKELNPQRNAEIFYRKAKNQQIEIDKVKESIGQKEKEIATLKSWIQSCEGITELKELRKITQDAAIDKKDRGQPENLPLP